MIGNYREVVDVVDGKELSYGAYPESKAKMVKASLENLYPNHQFILKKLS